MKVKDLIKHLSNEDPELEIVRDNRPLERITAFTGYGRDFFLKLGDEYMPVDLKGLDEHELDDIMLRAAKRLVF